MVRLVVSLLLALCLTPLLVLAQSDTATVSGLVTDSKGAVLVGAQVRAVNVDAGTRSTAFTNHNGVYVLHNLRPGQYRLIVDNHGFQQIVLVGLVLSAQDAVGRNFTMEIGSVIESLTITAAGQAVNISPAVGTVVNPQFVENLPLNGRSFQSLIGLTPGVDFVPTSGGGGGLSNGEFSINGQRTNSNYFTVDGVSANSGSSFLFDPGQTLGGTLPSLTVSGGTNGLLSVDAMQEFRVQTSTFAPEYGRSPAQISIVTRPATGQFHGTVYDYRRNNALDARNYFDQPPCRCRHSARMTSAERSVAPSSEIVLSSSFPMRACGRCYRRRPPATSIQRQRARTSRLVTSHCWRPSRCRTDPSIPMA